MVTLMIIWADDVYKKAQTPKPSLKVTGINSVLSFKSDPRQMHCDLLLTMFGQWAIDEICRPPQEWGKTSPRRRRSWAWRRVHSTCMVLKHMAFQLSSEQVTSLSWNVGVHLGLLLARAEQEHLLCTCMLLKHHLRGVRHWGPRGAEPRGVF